MSCREVAQEFDIALSTIVYWKRPQTAKQPKQRAPRKISKEALLEDIAQYPDSYGYERAKRFNCSTDGIHKALRRYGITRKKTNRHPKADPTRRKRFLKRLHRFIRKNRPIVYLDESGFRKNTYRPYGCAPRGKRCYARYDWQGRNQTNAIGALHGGRLFAVSLFDCSINRQVFDGWAEQVLIPNLPENSVVVMDNATFHKGAVMKMLEKHKHSVLWLSPYSPDLNPIEHTWAWIKRMRQKNRIDDIDRLFQKCI
ncbi:IS630 family transposase [Eikenella sp. S3360]|uniref:IS630 family transposase n=2 Tax=Eikenella glucosivorans TaxID=2766967 RepID=A0ABS0NCV0_9NEIS|nr:IS630 family transposase [Eikenella glucosivorans]